jgi:predicted Zn-dependent protease
MKLIEASYYDGRSTLERKVSMLLEPLDRLRVFGDGIDVSWALTQIRLSSRVGNTRRHLSFPDGSQCETADNDAIDELFAGVHSAAFSRLLHLWESKLRYVALALALTGISLWTGITYGVPALARQIAFRLPPETDELLGQQALEGLDKYLLQPTKLPPQRQAAMKKLFEDMTAGIAGAAEYEIELRASKAIGANALALPSGIVVVTDALVELSQNDDELIAVIAHEIGHLKQRHALRRVLQDSATVVVMIAVTGDISSIISVSALLPNMIVQSKYSRDFEREADDFAFDYLKRRNVSPEALTAILVRMEKNHASSNTLLDYVSSHPATKERAARANAAR